MSGSEPAGSAGGKRLISNLTAMGIFGILNTSFIVSYVSLIFTSSCPEYFAAAIALFLLGGCLVSICLATFSSYPGTISMIQDVPVAISALIAASLATMLSNENPQMLFANIFAAIALSTMLTGIALVLLGYFKLGNLVRFIPYPVMGGFLAATGWLLFKGGLQVSTGVTLDLFHMSGFFLQANPSQLICGIVLGVALLLLNRFFPTSRFIMPGTILGCILLFLSLAKLLGFSPAELQNSGWLLDSLPEKALWKSTELPVISLIDWGSVITHAAGISTIIVLSVISFLLNSTAIELIAGRDFDMNRDLKTTGFANIVISFLGVPASYIYVSETALATRIGAQERIVGILHGIFLLVVFIVGGSFLHFFPKFIAGGLLLFLGLSMLWEWLVDLRNSMPKIDYGIVLVIVLIVEFFGFLQGIGIGIIISVVIFVFRYSSINVIKNVLDGSILRSNKDRSIADQRLLDYNHERTLILQLQGFIFFGTANSLYEQVRLMVAEKAESVQYVVMDMSLVQGIDSSAIKSFEKLLQHLYKKGISLALVNVSPLSSQLFAVTGLTGEKYQLLHFFHNMNDTLEWSEDKILAFEQHRLQQSKQDGSHSGADLLHVVYEDMMAALDVQILFETIVEKTEQYSEKLDVSEGELLYKQGEVNDDLFFISRGQVVLLETEGEGQQRRIRTLGPWSIIGELGAFMGYHASHDAVVVKSGVVYKLSAAARRIIETEDQALAGDLHKLIIKVLGGQLLKTYRVTAT